MKPFMVLNLTTAQGATKHTSMEEWMAWFASMGDALLNHGAPFGERRTLGGDGSSGANGYMILRATDLDVAVALVASSPALASGQVVEVVDVTPPQMGS